MPVIPLNTLDLPELEIYRNLKKTNNTRWTRQFITEGKKPTVRLLQSDFQIESILTSEKFVDYLQPHLTGGRVSVPIYALPHSLCQMLVGFKFHCGMLGCGIRKPSLSLTEIVEPDRRQLFVVCPSTENRENMGAIIRIAAAFGVSAILLGKGCCDPFSRRTIRVSMGNALRIPILEAGEDLSKIATELKTESDVELIATALTDSAERLSDCMANPQRSCALVLGNEGEGLSEEWIELCDRCVTIPMQGGTDSLNVAVAAGILLHHFAELT